MFGEQLKRLRKEYKVTQQELAKALNIRQQSISQWENDTSEPLLSNAIKLADFYGISLDDLADRKM